MIEEGDDEIFGYYCDTEIIEKYVTEETDNKTFNFNLQSKNNRLYKPMKLEIQSFEKGRIKLYKKIKWIWFDFFGWNYFDETKL